MPNVSAIIEHKDVVPYLKSRGLFKQYKKAKQILLFGDRLRVLFKEREPQGSGIWSFRVNKQFRAIGFFSENGTFIVSRIDNHQ